MILAVGRAKKRFGALLLGGIGALVGGLVAANPARAAAFQLAAVEFAQVPGFGQDRLDAALTLYKSTCDRPAKSAVALPGLDRAAAQAVCAAARRGEGDRDPRGFFERHFQAFQIIAAPQGDAFFTGYYQPELQGALRPSAEFPVPVYGVPKDLVALAPAQRVGALEGLISARRLPDGRLIPFPDRAAIEEGALERGGGAPKKLVYLRDSVDLFLVQVQGSARVRLTDGRVMILSFAAKNGQPYTGLAKVLVDRGVAAPADMTMDRLTAWIRDHGTAPGQAGDALLRLNKSFVFFNARIDPDPKPPLGGAGAPLTAMRSIAVDSRIWPYGLPFYIAAAMPWRDEFPTPFERLMVAQDSGSAIIGPARADIFFGSGGERGARAGQIRHRGRFYVLLPRR